MARARRGTTTTTRPTTRPTRGARHAQRRGTVLLFALGVLAVIAVAALSYVTFVRLDRQGAAAVQRGVGYERQVNVVRDHIRALVAADLFGGKVVTQDVPRAVGNVQLWPRMFEDGEFRDYPWSASWSFDQTPPGQRTSDQEPSVLSLRSFSAGGTARSRFEIAPRDDAWLAQSEPTWDGNGQNMRGWWTHITNLRSGYVYDDGNTPTNPRDDRWVRRDGRFVDLGQLFLDYQTSGNAPRGNPGTDFLDVTLNLNNGGPVVPTDAAGTYDKAPYEQVFFMDERQDPVLQKQDERFWVDTDGDLRPDARWQVLESLGNYNGLIWVTAARIIDASSMVNFNTSIDGGFDAADAASYGTGRTPADVDLARLIWSAQQDLTAPQRYSFTGAGDDLSIVRNQTQFEQAMTAHIMERFGARPILDKLADDGTGDPVPQRLFAGDNWTWQRLGQRLAQDQRDALWRWHGSSPFLARIDLDAYGFNETTLGYEQNNAVDLGAFWGSNRRASLAGVEETFDGPDYLPRPLDAAAQLGPLLSDARPSDTLRQGTGLTGTPGEGRPTAREIRWNTRRLLTPFSGVGTQSPVPVLNMDARLPEPDTDILRFGNRFANEKIDLGNLDTADVSRAYEALVWALAPLATDEPLSERLWLDGLAAPVTGDTIDLGTGYHYGGTSPFGAGGVGPVERVPGYVSGDQTGATFALLTAAQLALNLKDITDGDDTPTVARLFTYARDTLGGQGLHDCPSTSLVELGLSFSHGDVPERLLSADTLGDRFPGATQFDAVCAQGQQDPREWLETTAGNTGMTIIGAERHPYIIEVFTAAGYTNVPEPTAAPANSPMPNNLIQVDGLNPEEYELGALVAVQLANPWPEPIAADQFEIRLSATDQNINSNAPEEVLRLGFPSDTNIPAGGISTFVFSWDRVAGSLMGVKETDSGEFPAGLGVVDILRREIEASGQAFGFSDRGMVLANFGTDADAITWLEQNPVFFKHVARSDMKVLLVRPNVSELPEIEAGRSAAVVLDRITTDLGATGDVFPMVPQSNVLLYGGILQDVDFDEQVLGDTRGYNLDTNVNPTIFTRLGGETGGRYMVTSSLTRPIRRPADGGFPAYVLDFDLGRSFLGFDGQPRTVFEKTEFAHGWITPADADGPDNDPLTLDDNDPIEIVAGENNNNVGQTIADFVIGTVSKSIGDSLLTTTEANEPAHSFDRVDTVANGKPADENIDFSTILPPWQLFIPNRPLQFVSEVGMAPVYATLCRNHQVNNLEEWRTVGQQLALSLAYSFDGEVEDDGTSAPRNPYLGVLDPSRFLPDGLAFADGNPDETLAVPLATRVFDCFEALDLWGDQTLVPGRINVNTAPERVLESLPLLAPAGSIPGTNLNATRERMRLVYRYREGLYPGEAFVSPDVLTGIGTPTGLPALRRGDRMDPPFQVPNFQAGRINPSGFAASGELAILDQWSGGGQILGTDGFLALGQGGADDDRPADVWLASTPFWDASNEPEVVANEPADDAEERLALYRAISNIASTRSDVYIAWFVVRGYDPDVIESIQVEDTNDPLEAMESEDPEFTPAYESRWMVVLDRSNVRRPTDRPRVLLQVELPSAKP